MKKINACLTAATLLAAAMSSAFAEQAPTEATLTISGSITGATCTVTFPTEVTMPAIGEPYYKNNVGAGGQLTKDVDAGNITINNCNGNTVQISTKSDGNLPGDMNAGTFTYANKNAGTEHPMYYTFGYKEATDNIYHKFDLTGATPVTFQIDAQGQRIVPLLLKPIKNGETLANIGDYTGNVSATVTYTASYN